VIKLNYKTLNSEGFNQALAQLSAQNGFASFDATYNVAKIAKQFGEELKLARELYGKWTEKFLVKGEDGKFKMSAKPHLCPWEIKEGLEEEFNKAMEDFLNTEITLNAKPLAIHDLGQIRLSPHQVLALEPIFAAEAFEKPEVSAH
jgi:hypothetical protein